MSAQSQNAFIRLIGNQAQQKVIKEIQHAGILAFMPDTTKIDSPLLAVMLITRGNPENVYFLLQKPKIRLVKEMLMK